MITEFFSTRYGLLITGIGLTVILLEIFEHFPSVKNYYPFFLAEIFLVILLLGATAILAKLLVISLKERSQALEILRLKHDLSMSLSSCHNMAEVSTQLAARVGQMAPSVGTELFLLTANKNGFLPASLLFPNGHSYPKSEAVNLLGFDLAQCRDCLGREDAGSSSLRKCPHCDQAAHGGALYCLPLDETGTPSGLLHFTIPSPITGPISEIELLENATPEISRSIQFLTEKKAREEEALAQTVRDVQVDVARDLHDSLAQNIGYLCMKMEQLSETSPSAKTDGSIEIKNLVRVANESYDLIRGTLTILQSGNAIDLVQLFTRYAQQVEQRSGFTITLTSQGKVRPLPPNQIRQFFYIFREVLSNVEKHARASHVRVDILWDEGHTFTLTISDDGCGFDLAQNPPESHYGLSFMRQRIEQMKGTLSIQSGIDAGTRIEICVPYPHNPLESSIAVSPMREKISI